MEIFKQAFLNQEFIQKLAYLMDLFSSINHLSKKLQGTNNNIVKHLDIIATFEEQLIQFDRNVK